MIVNDSSMAGLLLHVGRTLGFGFSQKLVKWTTLWKPNHVEARVYKESPGHTPPGTFQILHSLNNFATFCEDFTTLFTIFYAKHECEKVNNIHGTTHMDLHTPDPTPPPDLPACVVYHSVYSVFMALDRSKCKTHRADVLLLCNPPTSTYTSFSDIQSWLQHRSWDSVYNFILGL